MSIFINCSLFWLVIWSHFFKFLLRNGFRQPDMRLPLIFLSLYCRRWLSPLGRECPKYSSLQRLRSSIAFPSRRLCNWRFCCWSLKKSTKCDKTNQTLKIRQILCHYRQLIVNHILDGRSCRDKNVLTPLTITTVMLSGLNS